MNGKRLNSGEVSNQGEQEYMSNFGWAVYFGSIIVSWFGLIWLGVKTGYVG